MNVHCSPCIRFSLQDHELWIIKYSTHRSKKWYNLYKSFLYIYRTNMRKNIFTCCCIITSAFLAFRFCSFFRLNFWIASGNSKFRNNHFWAVQNKMIGLKEKENAIWRNISWYLDVVSKSISYHTFDIHWNVGQSFCFNIKSFILFWCHNHIFPTRLHAFENQRAKHEWNDWMALIFKCWCLQYTNKSIYFPLGER